ncbi:MAG TPA: MFS transporter [Candidatus Dormibacteraeota bacterium]|nr:MFS transporter [Candidatus Dormibacteraeota bacterium]
MTTASQPPESPDPSGSKPPVRNPWSWVPSLYLAEGLPYVLVMTVSVIMYKGMGISNTDIALYTGWLYFPWVIKPLWSPVVDILKTRRLWIWVMQLLIGAGLAGVALTIPTSNFFQYSLAFLWLLAFSSATHDIAADGYYMLATNEQEQAFFVGIRSTFYRIATIGGQGLLVIFAGIIQSNTGLPSVELEVRGKANAPLVQKIQPESMDFPSEQNSKLRVLAIPAQIEVAPQSRPTAEAKELVAQARDWNEKNGFDRLLQKNKTQATDANNESWWRRSVSGPLGAWLTGHFGEPRKKSTIEGNLGLAYLRLSRAPGKEVVVTLSQTSGGFLGFFKTANKSISVVEGGRLTFDDSNWNKPAVAVFQFDPKLREEIAAGYEVRSGDIPFSWALTFGVLVLLFLFFGIYHKFMLPYPPKDRPGNAETIVAFTREFFQTFGAFFRKERIGILLLFLLFYRFAEAQLVKLVAPFLLDAREVGGLGLTTGQVGFAYGTIGIVALTCGGLLGGMLASRHGLKSWLWPMVLIMHLPDAVFVYLAYAQPDNFAVINLCVAIEQFGYGFGFTAYMLYMIYIARGHHETAHYALCTGFMALGMMLPGMFSGWLQDHIGYRHFFIWVLLATIPGFVVAALVPLDREFGRKA